MDSASLTSLTNLLDGVDRWVELAPLLPVLVSLELVLSADNAVALAAIARTQNTPELQRLSLNVGIILALVLRIALILMAQLVLKFKIFQLIAAIYLLSLFINKVKSGTNQLQVTEDIRVKPLNLFITIILLALTDLAFSIDSVAAAVSISDQYLLVVTGAVIGVVALRFTSGLFIRWLDIYPRLEMSGYLAVAFVGIKLLFLLAFPAIRLPEWYLLIVFLLLFVWGFSIQSENSQENL